MAARQIIRIARIDNRNLTQHLTCDDLDVLIVDVYTLGDVHVLNLADNVAQRGVGVGQAQQVVRVDRALGELLANFDLAAVFHARQQLSTRGNDILADVALLIVDGKDLVVLVARDLQRACDLRKRCLALRLTCLEELGNTRKTVRDVFTCNTAGMERTHRKLRTRLTDRLCRDDAGSRADVDRTRSREVPAIALLANAVLCMAGHDAAVNERLNARIHERLQLSH